MAREISEKTNKQQKETACDKLILFLFTRNEVHIE